MDIVGVHGIGQYKFHRDPTELEKAWSATLAKSAGIPSREFTLAYYAPHLHLGASQGPREFNQLTEAESDIIATWLRSQGVPKPISQGRATSWLRDGLDWLIRVRGVSHMSQAVVAATFREVAIYTKPIYLSRRLRAQDVVAETIIRNSPRIIIAHSLGSVVTYETMWARPELEVDMLLTIGSPLALPDIFTQQFNMSEARQMLKPPGVGRWINFADLGDLIAVPKHLSNYFDGIELDKDITIGPIAFHGALDYLRHPEIGNLIRSCLSEPK